MAEKPSNRGWSWWYLLLIVLCAAALWVPFYNTVDPTLWGIPFFYWFQLLLVLASAVVIAVVHVVT